MFMGSRDEIGRLSKNHRLPAICQFREMAEAGCVASYGIILSDAVAVLAGMTDKALRGTRAGDIPARQPSRFELIINQKAARAMNITIPPAILARADEVIE